MRRERATAVLERADERLLAIVDPLVRLQIALLGEALAAALKLAHEWLFTHVRAHVNLQSTGARIPLSAHFALERLLTCVDQLVRLQVAFRDEALVAAYMATFEWTLPSLQQQILIY